MHEKFSLDDRTFDRLVDGELSPAERSELLASLDHLPDGWRRCALGFLEAQSWREGLGEFVRGERDVAGASDEYVPNAAVTKSLASGATADNESRKRGFTWLAIAASLIVAYALGTIAREGGERIADGQAADRGLQIADVVPPPADALTGSARADDALTFFVRDDTGQTRPLRVPLVDAGALERQLGLQFQSGVPAHVRSQLQTRGFDVQSKQRYAPLWLENGRPMFLPVEDTKIVPVGRNVY